MLFVTGDGCLSWCSLSREVAVGHGAPCHGRWLSIMVLPVTGGGCRSWCSLSWEMAVGHGASCHGRWLSIMALPVKGGCESKPMMGWWLRHFLSREVKEPLKGQSVWGIMVYSRWRDLTSPPLPCHRDTGCYASGSGGGGPWPPCHGWHSASEPNGPTSSDLSGGGGGQRRGQDGVSRRGHQWRQLFLSPRYIAAHHSERGPGPRTSQIGAQDS